MLATLAMGPLRADYPTDGLDLGLAGAVRHIDAGDFRQAEFELRRILETDTEDADVLNLLGFVTRKQGHYDTSRDYYDRALRIDPDHRGALEYKAELELETGNPDAARALWKRLQAACPEGCEELDALEAVLAAQEAR